MRHTEHIPEPASPSQRDTESYLAAVLAGDEDQASQIVDKVLDAGVSVVQVFSRLIGPVQRELGEMWAADRLSIALEHRATEITARQIERIRAKAPRRRALGATAAVACVAGEQHAMGARIVADLLFLDGWRVDFLGPNVPGEVIAEFVAEQGTNVVVLSVVLEDHVASVGEAVAAVRRSAPSAKILVGGPGIDEAGVLLAGADAHVATAEDVALVARNAAGVPMQLSLHEVLGLIGKRIEAERKMRKMSQQALADASGLDRAYISNVERGKQNVTIAALLRFADALGLSLGQLIDE